ncbi:LysR substrate-binding domain-containing protein [Dongia rigui]|uniref:LysR substrate-binding domain-containing protein n=1 Tax=Dongia rigui TaxID=940149 RepID=A0ABU5DXN9_9PROT|nr:LysR substrate-binding domain-containing protein [Dongia rigui]MDY0872084.1 LysR substrate-binding domain-containing protein [Dongia rigui]
MPVRRRLPSLNALRVFDVVARHLNFRLAAEELGVTQGAVAQQIRGLEAELGLALFDRGARSLTMTEAALAYIGYIRRAFELVAEGTASLRPEPRHLTISVTPSFAAKWLIPRLTDFNAAHPAIDLRILATDRLANFQNDAVDLAVRLGRPPFGAGLDAELLVAQIVIAVASPALVGKLGRPETGSNLARYPLLHDFHDFWPAFLERAFADKTRRGAMPAAPKHVHFNQTALAIDAAIAGQGLALASRFLVDADIKAGRLVQVLGAELHVGVDYYTITPRKPRHPDSVAALRHWLKANVPASHPTLSPKGGRASGRVGAKTTF